MAVFICITCGYVYDENTSLPDHGIEAGRAFGSLPADWVCPECQGTKDNFAALPLDAFLEDGNT